MLVRLSSVGNMSMGDLIRELVATEPAMGEDREMLRRCLEGKQRIIALASPRLINIHETASKPEEVAESRLVGFEDNLWVQFIRTRVVGGEGGERH